MLALGLYLYVFRRDQPHKSVCPVGDCGISLSIIACTRLTVEKRGSKTLGNPETP